MVHVMAYGPDELVEADLQDPAQVRDFLGRWPVTWIDVAGLGDAAVIEALGRLLGIHPLALEDVLNVHQRAKVEEYDTGTYMVVRMAELGEGGELALEQLSLFLGSDHVVTFQQWPGGPLDAIRERLRARGGRVREMGADYLAYALMDAVVDAYFPVVEHCDTALEELEEEILGSPGPGTVARLHGIRHDLLMIRRAVWPMRDAIALLMRESARFAAPETRLHLRDLYDHTVQILDLIEVHRDLIAGLVDIHLTNVSNRMNEVMRVLTVIATIFIPLSFLAGVYGMNFDTSHPLNMPELRWPYGYLFALGLMALVAGTMLLFFWRRGWLRSTIPRAPGSSQHGKSPEAASQ